MKKIIIGLFVFGFLFSFGLIVSQAKTNSVSSNIQVQADNENPANVPVEVNNNSINTETIDNNLSTDANLLNTQIETGSGPAETPPKVDILKEDKKVDSLTFSDLVNIGKPVSFKGGVSKVAFTLDKNNIPYVAYQSSTDEGRATLQKFDGVDWVNVGNSSFPEGRFWYNSLALDGNNVPYIAYQDGKNDGKASVVKFDGVSWVAIGNAGFSENYAQFISLALDSNNIPYIAYRDAGNDNKATVMKFDGSNWVPVGTPGFSKGEIWSTSLSFDSDNTPYLGYRDATNKDGATVVKFDGASWVPVGNPGFSEGMAEPSIKIDLKNIPYVAYQIWNNDTNSMSVVINKFDGTNWVKVASSPSSINDAINTTLVFDSNHNLYANYTTGDEEGNQTMTMMKMNSVSVKPISVSKPSVIEQVPTATEETTNNDSEAVAPLAEAE